MLILTRKISQSILIGDDIRITILDVKGHQVRVAIDAPQELKIDREECVRPDDPDQKV